MNRALTCVAAFLVSACGGEKTYQLSFSPVVAGQPLSCNTTFAGIGTTGSTLQLLDFKMYVHGVSLLRKNGDKHPLALTQDGTWQRDDIALLDFEDGSGSCNTGSPQTRTVIEGTAPDYNDYDGVEFTVGLKTEQNHLDAATAPSPLNIPGMWWSWKGGYKYIRLDARTAGNPAYYLHLGADSCEGTVSTGFTCAAGNLMPVSLSGFDATQNTLELDLAHLWKDVNVDQHIDGETDFVSGCMSGAEDPECPAVFSKLGLPIQNQEATTQTFFQVK